MKFIGICILDFIILYLNDIILEERKNILNRMQSIKYRFKNIALMMNNESVEIRKYCFAAGRISPFFFFF